jgi:single-strand DNA-binding protein
MNDTFITVAGNLVDDPQLRETNSGTRYVSFRVGSTSRRYDGETGGWIDGDRLFVGVKAWRGMAENIAASLKKGQPVVLTGRFYCREYVKDEASRVAYEVDVTAIGHDLSRGQSDFTKVARVYAPTSVEVDSTGLPVEPNDAELADGRTLTTVG